MCIFFAVSSAAKNKPVEKIYYFYKESQLSVTVIYCSKKSLTRINWDSVGNLKRDDSCYRF